MPTDGVFGSDDGFNSMIVRLKENFFFTDLQRITKFQFYDSPIKRPLIRVTLSTSTGFQFYDSPIKSLDYTPYFDYNKVSIL